MGKNTGGMDPTDSTKSFGELLSIHMKLGTGNRSGTFWNNTGLGHKLDVNRNTIRNWHEGVCSPDQKAFNDLLVVLDLDAGDIDTRDERRRRCELVLRAAWERSRKHPLARGADDAADKTASPFSFPENLPADLQARRAKVRLAVGELLEQTRSPDGTPLLAALKANWPDHTVPDPSPGDQAVEARRLFLGLCRAILRCNDPTLRWHDNGHLQGKVDVHGLRQTACHHLAELLSAMAWQESAWPLLEQAPRSRLVHPGSNAYLLQAGIAAARGEEFSLPGSSATPGDGRRDPGKWHLDLDAVDGGTGTDRDLQVLRALGRLLREPEPPAMSSGVPDIAARAREKFREALRNEIETRRDIYERSFALSQRFEDPRDPNVAQLVAYAERLVALPLPYTGSPSPYLRVDEDQLLRAIKHCNDAIQAIRP